MSLRKAVDALSVANLRGLRLAVTRSDAAREYFARCLREYDGLSGNGLPQKDPLAFIHQQGWTDAVPTDRVQLPTRFSDGAGLGLDELVILAAVTRLLKPRKVFEIGTYMGLSTSAFILNSPSDAEIVSLDLPRNGQRGTVDQDYAPAERELIREHRVGALLHELGLASRYQQILCDSLDFDPAGHADSVELGFIDGGHGLKFVRNDTLKMAKMMAGRGLVFWHDYGGRGGLLPLAHYLEQLSRSIPIYRVGRTCLAWTAASSLKRISPQDVNVP